MANKPSVVIKKTDSKKNESSATGIFKMDEYGRITLDTPDYGEVGLEPIVEELNLLNQIVEVKLTLKDEVVENVSYLEIC